IPRLLFQAVAVGIVVAALPADLRVVTALPWWLERAMIVVGSLWFVNLVNFMDGLDWMMVAEVVPTTAALVVFGQIRALHPVPSPCLAGSAPCPPCRPAWPFRYGAR